MFFGLIGADVNIIDVPPSPELIANLPNLRAALVALDGGANTIYNMVVLGDSLCEGGIADESEPNNYLTLGFVGQLRTYLASLYQDVGMGFLSVFHPHENAGNMWTLGAGWSLNDAIGWGVGKLLAIGSSGTGTITLRFTGSAIRIFHLVGSIGGSFKWKIDSGAETQVSTYAADGAIGHTDIAGLTDTSHTLTIKRIADGKDVYLLGALPVNEATKGMRINNCARWGTKAGDAISGDSPEFVDEMEIDYWEPVLTILAFGANDCIEATSVETFSTQLQSLITRAKAYGDVLLLNDACSPAVDQEDLLAYSEEMESLAATNEVAYFDLVTALGGVANAVAEGYIASDNTHWSLAGHTAAANILIPRLIG